MTHPAWPLPSPKLRKDGYQAQDDEARLRRPTDAGPPGYRRRYSAVARQVLLTLEATLWEKAAFDTFRVTTTQRGALPFTMPDPIWSGQPLLTASGQPLLSGEGAPLQIAASWLCLFGPETPLETIQAGRFQIAFSVSVMP